MHYLLDGYNLLFYLEESSNLQEKREEFLHNLNQNLSNFSSIITIVFDGKDSGIPENTYEYFSSFLVVFSSRPQTADEYILETIQASAQPANFTVITEDQKLAFLVKQEKAHHRNIAWFIRWVEKKTKSKREKPEKDSFFHEERLRNIFEKKLRNDEE